LSQVRKKLNGREVLKDISFEVETGDIFGYLGPNGAGKTTSIRIILGLLHPDAGMVSILGQDVTVDKNRKHVGFVLEADGLYESINAVDNLVYYARLYGVTQPVERIDAVLSLVGLKDRARDKISTYSKGMRQRLSLARALMHNPDVLVLDEPTAGVDPTGQIEVRRIVLDMAHKEGKTILFSSHNLDEVQRICNRIALIDRGEIKLYGKLEEMQRRMGQGGLNVETSEPVPETIILELGRQNGVTVSQQQDRQLSLKLSDGTAVSDIISFLSSRGVKIEQVKREDASLEDIYTTILKEAEVH
jgi:ABC-2 type transport system ATP-binding protein